MRRVDRATVAGYYGSDSAGTFATCVAASRPASAWPFDAYMPVISWPVMEIPGCLRRCILAAAAAPRDERGGVHGRTSPAITPRGDDRSGARHARRARHSDAASRPAERGIEELEPAEKRASKLG